MGPEALSVIADALTDYLAKGRYHSALTRLAMEQLLQKYRQEGRSFQKVLNKLTLARQAATQSHGILFHLDAVSKFLAFCQSKLGPTVNCSTSQ